LSEIAKRAWREPAVFLGFVTSAALAIITVATGDPWDTAAIVAVIAPLASALGIRQLVTPTPPAEHAAQEPPATK
jgi:hypothetical protein